MSISTRLLIGAAASVCLSTTLIWAALEKLRMRQQLRTTLQALGLRGNITIVALIALPSLEVLAGGGLLVAPESVWPRETVMALAVVFAVAGGLALFRGIDVPCSCFGQNSGTRLGRPQLLALPLWTVGLALSEAWAPAWPWSVGILWLTGALLGITTYRAAQVCRAAMNANGDRRAHAEGIGNHTPMFRPRVEANQ